MTKHPLNADELLGSREMRFIDRQETNFPNLMRLCMDFDFCVLQLLHRSSLTGSATGPVISSADGSSTDPITSADPINRADNSPVNKSFILVTRDYRLTPTAAISPSFDQLEQLETYVRLHQVDILHDYLFGFVDEDILSSKASGE